MKNKIKYSGEPFDSTNSSNPWLMNNNKNNLISDPKNGNKLTAEYIWSLQGEERKSLVGRVFKYYRNNVTFDDLVKPGLTDEKAKIEFKKLEVYDTASCVNENGEIKNSNSTCTNILKQFCGPKFYSSKGGTKNSKSCREVYENDEYFMSVLKNRMGWKTTGEDGNVRPYIFAISNKMIVQGMRSSGLGYTVSTFKPAIAKYVYEKYNDEKNNLIFDYSAGWGARALGAAALQKEYWGIDPLTFGEINDMMNVVGAKGKVICGGSEDPNSYSNIVSCGLKNKFGLAFSSPPYFDLEVYSRKDKLQCTNVYSEYDMWLNIYWSATVKNVKEFVLKKQGSKFILAMVNKVKKHDISNDMIKICENNGMILKEFKPFKTSKSHLSSKRKTGINEKTTEGIYIFSV